MDARLNLPFRLLRFALGLTATLAGLDKFFNILADWGAYVSPLAARVLPFSVATFMGIVGVIEIAVGVAILAAAPRRAPARTWPVPGFFSLPSTSPSAATSISLSGMW